MNDRIIFSSMTLEAKRFYSKVFNNAALNAYAVRNGLFDCLLCETTDSSVNRRWNDARPFIIEYMMHNKKPD